MSLALSALPQALLIATRDVTRFTTLLEVASGLAREAGIPLDRMFLGTLTLHPQTSAFGVVWTIAGGAVEQRVPHQRMAVLQTRDSPLRRFVMENLPSMRVRLAAEGDQGLSDLTEMVTQGYADFAAWALRWNGRPLGAITYLTRLPSGFTDEQLSALEAAHAVLEARVGTIAGRETLDALLSTYLGVDAGQRVLLGQVKRGDGQTLRAAIWFSDLRGFSGLSESLERDDLLALLNEAFELQVAAIHEEDGDVLKFIGDGLLAIFRVRDGHEADACARALRAAVAATRAVQERNAQHHRQLGIGIALHLGDVMYGNIGSSDRLDFTVIGPAVNRAARIESAAAQLRRQILTSAEFATHVGTALKSVAQVELKGIEGTHEVFSLPA